MRRTLVSIVWAAAGLLFAFVAAAMDGPGGTVQDSKPKGIESVTSQDVAVIRACLEDFRAQTDLGLVPDQAGTLVVNVDTRGPSWFLSNSHLTGDLEGRDWRIPIDAEYQLRRRNEVVVSLRDIHLGDKTVMDDFKRRKKQADPSRRRFGFMEVMEKAHSGLKAYVTLWLPGYTKDGTKCVLRLSFGPSPHGSDALYLLENRKGKWVVVHRAIIDYA
jgi:hypothetical protein